MATQGIVESEEVSSCPDFIYDPQYQYENGYGWKDTEEEYDEKQLDAVAKVKQKIV